MSLTDKQIRFCEEYLANGNNATQAALAAGYSEESARQIGSENLTKLDISAYIEERQRQIFERLQVNQDRIVREYARIAFADIRKYYRSDGTLLNPYEIDEDAAAALAGIEIMEEKGGNGQGQQVLLGYTKKIKTYDKIRALDSLGEHFSMFTKKVDLTTKGESLNDAGIEKLSADEKLQLFRLKQKMRDA